MKPSADFWRGKRVLLTGHTGFKGAWCRLWLERLGAQVFGLGLAPEDPAGLYSLTGGSLSDGSIGNILDPALVSRRFHQAAPDIVIHMAAQALVRRSYDEPVETFETNVMGLVRILEAVRRTQTVRAIVNVTSDKCYENRDQIWSYREDDPMGGADPYSASKGCAELVTASYRRSYFNGAGSQRLASARAGNVIGGGDTSPDRLVPDCIRCFEQGRPVLIRNPLATRPWQHVLDPVCGYLLLAQALYEGGDGMDEGWNFGPSDDGSWPVSRIVEVLADLWGDGAAWRPDLEVHPKEARMLRVDSTKARMRLGWRPRLELDRALVWTVDWWRAVRRGASAIDVTRAQIDQYAGLL